MGRAGAGLLAAVVLAACVPQSGSQTVPVEVAEAECARSVIAANQTTVGATVRLTTGNSNRTSNRREHRSGASVSAAFPLGSASLTDQYNSCVLRRSGQPPVTPLGQRPEVRARP